MLKEAEIESFINTDIAPSGTTYILDTDGVQKFPVCGDEMLHKVANHLYESPGYYPYQWRRDMARNLLKEAKNRGETLKRREYFQKAAGYGVGDPGEIAEQILVRSEFVVEGDEKGKLKKLASDVRQLDPNTDLSRKCASFLASIDEQTGEYRRYRRQTGALDTPEESTFHMTEDKLEKTASDMVKLANGEIIHPKQLQKAPSTKIAALIGGDFEKNVLNRLPEQGITPEMAENLSKSGSDILCRMIPAQNDLLDEIFGE